MTTFTLTDSLRNVWVDSFQLGAKDLGAEDIPWSVTKSTCRGGRREGVDLIEVDNGLLRFSVVPTRGMGIWKARCQNIDLGWQSPVKDGPINPAFVNLMNWGGLGWLEGFDELLARCGLENNGAPYTEGATTYGLHGRIANAPAHYVAVHADRGLIAIEGHVDESKLFSTQIRMISTITTAPGSSRFTVRDEFQNLSDLPQDMQILYHWNLGPPLLEEGARFHAPVRTVVPRNPRAAQGIGHYDIYGPPEPGFAEQVYFLELLAKPGTGLAGPGEGNTLAMLTDRQGKRGVALRFSRAQLPSFTLWKCTGGLKSGYVTGLEPGSNYPNPRPFEKERGRVITLPPGSNYITETTFDVLTSREAVAAVETEIADLQRLTAPNIHRHPTEPFTNA